MKPEQTVDFHIKYTWQAIAKMYNEVAGNYGTTMATGYVLLNVDLEKGTPSTSLGPKMGMEATSLSRILKNMEEKGLIERRPHPQDKRSVLIFLTPFGVEKREDAKRAVLDFNNQVREILSEEEIQLFFRIMNKINQVVINKKTDTASI
ncbi:MAG: MarR family winged helix-turn-helix transcriptional regulator [Bacteroidota bacterium]|nr:MarR family winged helix-turn-helix transcriptional regulator [Bacteroidota bacterium]